MAAAHRKSSFFFFVVFEPKAQAKIAVFSIFSGRTLQHISKVCFRGSVCFNSSKISLKFEKCRNGGGGQRSQADSSDSLLSPPPPLATGLLAEVLNLLLRQWAKIENRVQKDQKPKI